ncbi:MAG: sensor histidine kinase [Thermoanaerobaculia bacterium]
MSRVRWKLLTAMIVVVAVTVGLSGLFTRRITHEQVKRLVVARMPPPGLRLARIEQHYRANGWKGVESVLDRIVLTTPQRNIIAVSPDLASAHVRVDGNRVTISGQANGRYERLFVTVAPASIRDASGRIVGLAWVLPPADREGMEVGEIAALDQRLIVTFAGATLVAILLTFFISRRITQPIERLTVAVDEMARGKLPSRVPVQGNDEIARLARSFNSMSDAIRAQEELRRRLVSDVAHELRTPLTNLRCELEAIQDGLTSADPSRISSLHEEVLHLGRLADDLQELAIADAGGLTLQREDIDLAVTVRRVVELYRTHTIELEADEGVIVNADAMRISQIIRNLLDNAVHHGDRVRVRVSSQDGDAKVSVSDNGSGIPEPELERVFERFYRVDESRARQSGGAGLGLAIVRRLAELHGGRVWAESVVGSGATFTFAMPMARH